jgi:hypothetical protein
VAATDRAQEVDGHDLVPVLFDRGGEGSNDIDAGVVDNDIYRAESRFRRRLRRLDAGRANSAVTAAPIPRAPPVTTATLLSTAIGVPSRRPDRRRRGASSK